MKKIILTTLFALTSMSAFASGSVTVEYHSWKNQKTNTYTDGIVLAVSERFTKNISGNVVFAGNKARATEAIGSRLEVGATYTAPLGPVNLSLRTAVGQRYSNTANSSYYSVQPSVAYRWTDRVTTTVGFRYRDSFSSTVKDKTDTVQVGASYALTKNNIVGVRVDRVTGDSDLKMLAVNFTRRF